MPKTLAKLLLIALVALAGKAEAASITPFNPSQLQIPATGADFNTLIAAINAIITPLLPNVTAGVNAISLTAGVTGQPAQIGFQAGADTNVGIQINPNGSGNIILFGQTDTGSLQFGNSASIIPATGLAPTPGVVGTAPLGVNSRLTGYFIVKDWLGRSGGVAVY